MRKIIYTIIGFFLFSLFGCGGHTIIPDAELSLIFRDAFLANAYISEKNISDLDSLNIYEPIFEDYGYTTDDVHYTIGNFSKRKSARLGDVVEIAIDMLEKDGLYYEREVAILDTINNVSQRAYTRTVYSDSLIKVYNLRDTSRLEFAFGDIHPGEYILECMYQINSTTKNGTIRVETWMERSDSVKRNTSGLILRRNKELQYTRTFKTDTTICRLIVDFLNFDDKPFNPKITVRDLSLTYVPTADIARDSLYSDEVNIRIFTDKFLNGTKDSL